MSTPSYNLIRSRRKTISLSFSREGELVVRAPLYFVSIHTIERFIMEKSLWIAKHQKQIRKHHELTKSYTPRKIEEMKIELLHYITRRIEKFYDESLFPKYTNIKITKSERRWGSCSAKNGLCFSYRLAEYLPKENHTTSEFIDAIIVHELSHLKEKNHQKPFWNLVYSIMPEYESIMGRQRRERFSDLH